MVEYFPTVRLALLVQEALLLVELNGIVQWERATEAEM
jgi:hypothetical protein